MVARSSLWDPESKRAVFVEVKGPLAALGQMQIAYKLYAGPGDRLSATQREWIEVLQSASVEVEVCSVVTQAGKDEMDEKEAKRKARILATKRGRDDDDSD